MDLHHENISLRSKVIPINLLKIPVLVFVIELCTFSGQGKMEKLFPLKKVFPVFIE
jgi:hypothetical protein